MHYHLVINQTRQRDEYPDADAAREALGAELERLQAEVQNQGHQVRLRQLGAGYLVTWWQGSRSKETGVLSGWTVAETTGCTVTNHDAGQLATVIPEVFALSADSDAIYLISPGAWRSGPLRAGADPHEPIRAMLAEHGALDDAKVIHSTSWRADGSAIVVTFIAALRCPHVRQHWPQAQRLHPAWAEIWGPVKPHEADQPPTPRDSDVLMHALGHLRERTDPGGDATITKALGPDWRRHLMAWEPALAGMYAGGEVPEVLLPKAV